MIKDTGEARSSGSSSERTNTEWWRSAVVYQIYPRSFADSNGDGMGDIPGITSRVGYLKQLGVDAVWLCPFYPSALYDGGYDVDDYRDVDEKLGTLADFDEMVATLHAADIKVIVDVVPNHTSIRHPWFAAALEAGPNSPERDRYLFRDGEGPDGNDPPNDWQSGFGGSAWEQVPDGQWYFHYFAREQPDLNWDHEGVRADFRDTLRFWSDRGVDGFRVDVAHGLVKDMSTPYHSWADISEMIRPDGSHPLWDRDDVHRVYAEWRQVFDSYDPPRFAVAEASVHPSRRARYASQDSLGQAFNFAMQEADWKVGDFRRVIDEGLADMYDSGSTTTWLLGCHDGPRVASRFGLPLASDRNSQRVARDWILSDGTEPAIDAELGERRSRAAVMILFALPGCTYVYQGDELGLQEVPDLPREALEDPMATRSPTEKGRDGCRVPLPWTADGPSYGFGSGPARPPQPPWFADYAVEVQGHDPDSTLSLYRTLLRLRAGLARDTEFHWHSTGDEQVLHFSRAGGWHCLANFAGEPHPLPPREVLVASGPLDGDRLPADTAVWLRLP